MNNTGPYTITANVPVSLCCFGCGEEYSVLTGRVVMQYRGMESLRMRIEIS
jgi:hypothetical protein